MLWSVLLSVATAADVTVDLAPAMADAKKPVWEPKGKAVELFGRGDTKADNEAWPEAMDLLSQALVEQPGCGKCLDSLGTALVEMNHFDEALQVADRMLALYPDRKEGVWLKLIANSDAHRAEAALASTEAYLKLDPTDLGTVLERHFQLLVLGRFDDAEAKLADAKTTGKVNDANLACMKTMVLAFRGDLAGGKAEFAKCDVDDALLAYRRIVDGYLLLAEGQLVAAQNKLSQSGNADLESRLTLAFVRLDEKKYDQALNLATKLAADAPWAIDVDLAHARALVGLGRADDATAALKARLLADGWEGAALTADRTILPVRSPSWPKDVGAGAAATQIALLVAKGDAAGAQALHDAAVKAWGERAELSAALTPPAAPAATP